MRVSLIIYYLSFCCYSSAQITFQKPIIFNLYGCAPTSVVIEDDGYVIASYGRTEYDTTFAYRWGVILHKTDLSGELIWEKV